MNWQASEFWQFSLECYQQHQQRFLQLQDNFQLNINLLLFAMFADIKHKALTIEQWQEIIVAIEQSNQIIQHHRATRRLAKRGDQQQYKRLREQELQLEGKQQQQIISTVNTMQTITDSKANNIDSYCFAAGNVVNPSLAEMLRPLNS